MTDKKITQLDAGTTPLAGTELVELVQAGVNVQVTAQDIADLGGGGFVMAWAQWEASGPSFTGNGIITSIEQVIHISGTDLEVTFASGYANSGWCVTISVDQTNQDGILAVHPISATKVWLEFGVGEGHWQPDRVNIHAIPINSI
jgi:hypothetical protein